MNHKGRTEEEPPFCLTPTDCCAELARMRVQSMMPLLLAGYLTACGSSITSPFVVNLTLDQAATAELRRTGEHVKLIAYYYWTPNSGGPSHSDNEFGYVLGGHPVGEEVHEIPGTARVTFAGHTQPSLRVQAGSGEMKLLINVVSARRVNPNNILGCGVYEGSLAAASRQGININCSLPERHRH